MSGCMWKFSDQIDDVDVEMLRRDFMINGGASDEELSTLMKEATGETA